MIKTPSYRSFFIRLGLQILALEAAFLLGCWLLNRYWNLLQRFRYTDVLFLMGSMVALMGSAGILRSPYWQALSPAGIWASPVQPTEKERREQLMDELMRQNLFGLRMVAIGVITILLSIAMTYIKLN